MASFRPHGMDMQVNAPYDNDHSRRAAMRNLHGFG
jgi:hypothetical protein